MEGGGGGGGGGPCQKGAKMGETFTMLCNNGS